jgi:hypothetical protein
MRKAVAVTAAGLTAVLVVLAGPTAVAVADGSATPATPGTSGTSGTSAIPTYRTAGTAVKGTVSSTDAPPIKPGIYTDTIGVGEKKYYGVDLDDSSSAFVSAVAAPKPGTAVTYSDGISVSLLDTDNLSCSVSGDASFGSAEAARPIADYASRRIVKDGPCQDAGHYLVAVERDSAGTSDPGDWPIEIRLVLEPGVRNAATTAPSPSSWSSATPAPPTGTAKAVGGGTGFNDATELRTGVYTDGIIPGQTLFYEVPVDWGQQLFTTAEFGNGEPKEGASGSGFAASGIQLDLYNPARGPVTDDSASYDGDPAEVALGTAPALYANRLNSATAVSAMRFSGVYYLEITLSPAVADFVTGKVPFTLRITVKGDAQAGPAYIDGSGASQGSLGSLGSLNTGSGAGGESALRLAGFAALGAGTVLVLSLAVWTVTARRRAADTVR